MRMMSRHARSLAMAACLRTLLGNKLSATIHSMLCVSIVLTFICDTRCAFNNYFLFWYMPSSGFDGSICSSRVLFTSTHASIAASHDLILTLRLNASMVFKYCFPFFSSRISEYFAVLSDSVCSSLSSETIFKAVRPVRFTFQKRILVTGCFVSASSCQCTRTHFECLTFVSVCVCLCLCVLSVLSVCVCVCV
jgi:hypothetical protein